MTPVFADSFYFLALFNPRDASHDKAVAESRSLTRSLVTTDWVLTEVADALCDPVNRGPCVEMIDDLRRSPRVDSVPASRTTFEQGWALYRERPDKDWSLTDCFSFVVMEDRGITDALTGDLHFEQAGYRALLRE